MSTPNMPDIPIPSFDRSEKRPRWVRRVALPALGRISGIIAILFTLGLSLLPLASLLLIIPAIFPQESILVDTVRPARNAWKDILRRIFAVLTALGMLLTILAFSVEIVTQLRLQSPYFAQIAETFLGTKLASQLPPAMVQGWPSVLLIAYATDLIILFCIGKVPLQYNYRNLLVRWRITLLTGLAFTVVVALLTVMLGFVNGLNDLAMNSGVPGNVIILSEGATDEIFSNLGYGDISKLELEKADQDAEGNPLPRTVNIKSIPLGKNNELTRLCSKETYFVITQQIPRKPGEPSRSRFAQLRGIQNSLVTGKVHNMVLLEGEWFEDSGSISLPDGTSATPAVLGEGAATKFAEDVGKARLHAGDTFMLNDLKIYVTGIMKSDGSTYGSEIWSQYSRVSKVFRKESYTTVVIRVEDDSVASAQQMAVYLSNHFKNPRITARTEQKYFEDISKNNSQFLYMVMVVAIIMAIGGIFGVMNTMFAAISQRIKDIGVLRILGFKRWQILVSFMLESLAIAILGGLLGIALGSFFDGAQVTSTLSGGQGSGKMVIMRIVIDTDVVICGILFTIIMGRLGGLVPSLSAMRLGILQSLR
jgi:putative ABC transport system permease protein